MLRPRGSRIQLRAYVLQMFGTPAFEMYRRLLFVVVDLDGERTYVLLFSPHFVILPANQKSRPPGWASTLLK